MAPPPMASRGSSHSVETESSRDYFQVFSAVPPLGQPWRRLVSGLYSEELSQGLLMSLSEPLRTAVLSCARGTHTVGLLQEAAAWHPTGAEGGLKESWVRTPQGFPEQGWRSAVNPWRQIIESMHATVRLALHIPEAGGLVWVVDGQADSSDVLQSLCCTSEKVVLGG